MVRPYVLLSVATSIDGCIDDTGPDRLVLSNDVDWDRVDQVRADADAIMIGAGTLRADNPRLHLRGDARRAARVASGKPEYPLKVTLSASGQLDPALKFWHHGNEKVVYTVDAQHTQLRDRLSGLADVVSLGDSLDFGALLDDLGKRGVGTLMVEGGSAVHTAFLSAGLVDEIHLAIAPIVVGEPDAPHFLNPARYPGAPHRRMQLIEARPVGDMVLARYRPK